MAYNRTNWENTPSTETPINADNLNNIEEGVTANDTAITNLLTKMNDIDDDIALANARIDTFAALPEGSTAGDAEIADARIDNDGNTYSNLGNSIRGQIKAVAKVSAEEPDDGYNLIWVKPSDEEVEIPTMEDIEAVSDQVADLKADNNYLNDIINKSIGCKYIDFEQGTISSSGDETDNSNWVRTDFIPIETFLLLEKPIGIQLGKFYYDENKTFIDSGSSSQIISEETTYNELRNYYPNAVYVRMRIRMYEGTTGLQTTPEMVIASDLNIKIAQNINSAINSAINKGHIDVTDLTLSESYQFTIPYSVDKYKNMLFTIRCKYTGTQPTVSFLRSWVGSDGRMHQYYISASFPIGGADYVENTFRIPRFFETSSELTVIFTIPTGTTLSIAHMFNSYSDNKYISDTGINLNGHGKYGCGAPVNTMLSFKMAHMMGYKYCITIPKITSDGVLVCLHDDNSIQSTARNDDGSTIASEYQNRPVSDFTYEQLLQFDFGIHRGIPFKGERIPKLEDFFELCAKTGMHPMLSCHPSLSGHWAEIKTLAVKYNILNKLNIKCDYSNITVMMDVLGGDIESYTIDESGGVDRAERMTTLIQRYSIDVNKCRCGVEYITTITDTLIESALNAGLFVGFYGYGTNASQVKELIEKGVTEFTDDYIASVGLNW